MRKDDVRKGAGLNDGMYDDDGDGDDGGDDDNSVWLSGRQRRAHDESVEHHADLVAGLLLVAKLAGVVAKGADEAAARRDLRRHAVARAVSYTHLTLPTILLV
eukprot:781010-Pleurochrysis_carterae.AAC.2